MAQASPARVVTQAKVQVSHGKMWTSLYRFKMLETSPRVKDATRGQEKLSANWALNRENGGVL